MRKGIIKWEVNSCRSHFFQQRQQVCFHGGKSEQLWMPDIAALGANEACCPGPQDQGSTSSMRTVMMPPHP